MSLKDFFKRRLVRLHPMVIMGSPHRRAVLLLRGRGLSGDRRRTVVEGVADLPAGLYDAARAAVVGHPRLGRDQPAERPLLVAALRIHRQHPLCPRHPALLEIRAGAVRGRGRGADAGPHAEPRSVRPASRRPFCSLYRHRRLERQSDTNLHRLLASAVPPSSRVCCSRASARRSACGADSGGARC